MNDLSHEFRVQIKRRDLNLKPEIKKLRKVFLALKDINFELPDLVKELVDYESMNENHVWIDIPNKMELGQLTADIQREINKFGTPLADSLDKKDI
jgi:hypothetical protein